jgi:hypothetical protein
VSTKFQLDAFVAAKLYPFGTVASPHAIAAADAEERRLRLEYLKSVLDADLVVHMHTDIVRFLSTGATVTIEGTAYSYVGAVGSDVVLRKVDR